VIDGAKVGDDGVVERKIVLEVGRCCKGGVCVPFGGQFGMEAVVSNQTSIPARKPDLS
jgi:hypothetical protein